MTFPNPAAWNGISIVTLMIFLTAGFIYLLLKGHLMLGVHHRQLMAEKDREIAAKDALLVEDARSIAKFAEAANVTTVTAEVQQALVTAIREVAQERMS